MAKQESGFEPNAVSSAGAEGIMQLMPVDRGRPRRQAFDPAQAIDGAAQLCRATCTSTARWRWPSPPTTPGAGTVAEYGGIPPYAETQNYVSAIMQAIGGAGMTAFALPGASASAVPNVDPTDSPDHLSAGDAAGDGFLAALQAVTPGPDAAVAAGAATDPDQPPTEPASPGPPP